MLGGDIGGLERGGPQPVGRGDIDDPAPAPFRHARQAGPDGVKGRVEADGHDALPIGILELLDGRHFLDAGIVDQHIDPAEARQNLVGQRPACGGIGQIRLDIDDLARAEAIQLGDQTGPSVGRLKTVERHRIVHLSKFLRDREPNTARRSRHQRNAL
ncbi:hypothetical protein D3C87_1659730 [compost metagenome]